MKKNESEGFSLPENTDVKKEKVFDYKSSLEEYFEKKNFFNEKFSKEDLQKLFELLIRIYFSSLFTFFSTD